MNNKQLVMGEGPFPCQGMILGEAPGKKEQEQGKPFVGSSGELLEEALAVAGVNRKRIFITNVYKLRPPANRTPTPREIGEHAMLLHDELAKVNPVCVLALGHTATEQFLYEGKSMTDMRGKPRKCQSFWVIPTWHPAYVLRSKNRKEEFMQDVDLFVQTAYGKVDDTV